MKLPRISISAIMTAVIVIALDCFTVRAFQLRGASFRSGAEEIALWVLPMTHVLAIVFAILVRDRTRPRPFWIGFALGGLIGIVVTASNQTRIWTGLEWMIERSGREDWLESMSDWTFFLIELAIMSRCIRNRAGCRRRRDRRSY